MTPLRASERRSLSLLVELAASRKEAPRLLRSQAARMPARLRAVADEIASAWERGERPGSELGLAGAEDADALRREIDRRALPPVLTASLALLASSVGLAVAAPAVHALLTEATALLGGAPPSALLALLASHARAILAGGVVASLAAAVLPPVALRRGSSRARRALAVKELAAELGALLRGGMPPHEAVHVAAGRSRDRTSRAVFLRCAERLAAGEPADVAFDEPRQPLLAGLRALALDPSPVVTASRVEERAAREALRAAARFGAAAGLAGYALTAACALLLVVVVLLPLATFGGGLP